MNYLSTTPPARPAPLSYRLLVRAAGAALLLLLLALALLPLAASAQTITSFTPTSGPVGTSVTLTGTGFNATAAQNVVFFGATRAAVTVASATSLTVTVPSGTTYQYPTVTNLATALTAYAAQPFVVTLNGAVAFAPKADVGTDANPRSVAIRDLDGDGKPDLATANRGSNTVSVLRNTSTAGTVSFAARVDLVAGAYPYSLAIGDVDGDGKPDLAVTNVSDNTVSVLRNTSTAGTVSFAAPVNFGTGFEPTAVVIGDVDGDGKPDLAATNGRDNTVSVLRNTGTAGTVSFAAKVDFGTDNYPTAVAIGDLDGDGKPDLAVANLNYNTVSVLRNTSTAGTVSFAPRADKVAGASPYSVAIGDLDGDGKPDLAVATPSASTVSVLRNTSTAGTVSFDYPVDLVAGINPYSVAIGDVDGDGKPDLALANPTHNTASVMRNLSTAGTVSFVPRVDFTTGAYPYSLAIGDVDGDGKPDLAVANYNDNTVSVLRQVPPPVITSFTPTSGPAGTSVTITGTSLGGATSVSFNGTTQATITSNTATSLTVAVPTGATTGTLTVTTAGGNVSAASSQPFTVPPVITSFTPTSGPVGTSVTITGTNLDNASSVSFNGGVQTMFTSNSPTQLVLLVPAWAITGPLTVTTANGTSAASSQSFTVPPVITSFTPTSGPVGTSVTITGTGLGGATSVRFNGTAQTTFTSNAATSLTVAVPTGATTGTLTVTMANGTSAASSQTFTVVPPPVITSFTPLSGPVGASVTITGTNLDNASSVRFNGGVPATITANTATSLTVTVPAGTTTGTLTVTTGGNNPSAASSQSFTVEQLAITSFAPTSGPVGTSVTITGTGLGAAAGQYAVFFGATRATVTATSATSLTVTVPTGATYQYPTVTNLVSGRTAYAAQPFAVTLNGAVAFAPKVDVSANIFPYSVAIGDLDGDGRPDVAMASPGGSLLTVFRNTSTAGVVSFAARATFSITNPANSVAIGDVDGDGRPDVAITSGTSTVSVFRNTSTVGTVSFATKLDLVTGTTPTSVVIGDLSRDGRPDLVVVNQGNNTVSVFRNTSTGVGAVSFSARLNVATGTTPYLVAIGDVDGDGVPDLATANSGTNNVSVLRNLSTVSTFGFATKVDVTVGTGPRSVAIGDVDGDGKPDLAVANYTTNNVSVLRNTGTAGTVSFATKVDVLVGTNPHSVAIGDVDGDGKPDLAVGNYGSNTVSVLRSTSTAGTVSFATRANFTAGTNPQAVAIGDLDGDGKPDLAVGNGGSAAVSVLRQVAQPVISSFTPLSGPVGTSVTITGTGLDNATGVRFNGWVQATFTSNSATEIVLLVPAGATTGRLTVTTAGGNLSAASSQPFTVTAPPVLTAVVPNPGGLGQVITLIGTNLGSPTALTINGANALAGILSTTSSTLVVRVPVAAAATGVVSLSTSLGTATAPFTVMAAPGNALAFDGVDDYLALPNTTPMPMGNSTYTLEAWMKPTAMGVEGIIGWGNWGTPNQVNALRLSPTGIINYWWGPDLIVTTPDLSGRWHHVAATFDGTTRTIYLDGVAVGSDTPGTHTVPSPTNLRIGCTNDPSSGAPYEYFNGSLDEVRVYSVALTPAQLQADMTSLTAAVPASLVLYLNLDQGTPADDNTAYPTLYDLSSNATPATLTNFDLSSGNTSSNYVASYALAVPAATAATSRTPASFIATWTAPANGTVTSYVLDVSTAADFSTAVSGSPFAAPASATSYGVTGLTQGTTYYYRVRALNSNLTQPDQGAESNVISVATPLPVVLTQFTATAEGSVAVRLAWATASEKNSHSFEVERSVDGTSFGRIGTAAAAGTTATAHSYTLLDAALPAGASALYYRLRQVDLDGTANYSPVRVVALAGGGPTLFPNPAHSAATLTGVATGQAVQVLDALGRLVLLATADASGTAPLALPAGLPGGVYIVRAGTQALRLTVE